MISFKAAQQILIDRIPVLDAETVSLEKSFKRIAREVVAAPISLPPFDNCAVDGYAVRREDLAGATSDKPRTLELAGRLAAGESHAHLPPVSPGTCVRVFTGSMLPVGADAVVMQEDVIERGNSSVAFVDEVKPFEHVRLCGEDIKRGGPVLSAGETITIGRLGLLAASGIAAVRVGALPRVAIIVTGNELIERGNALPLGAIYESNGLMLSALAQEWGAIVTCLPMCGDDKAVIRQAIKEASEAFDVVITSGGVSVGDLDWVNPVLNELGAITYVRQIAMKPGKPFVFAILDGRPFFGLPGNPISALTTLRLLVCPALLAMQGAGLRNLSPSLDGTLAETLTNRDKRRHFVRVCRNEAGDLLSSGLQASHVFSSAARSCGLVDVEPTRELAQGSKVKWIPWERIVPN